MVEIVTERPRLRPFRADDLAAFVAYEARLVGADWFTGEWSTLRVFAVLRREWDDGTATAGSRIG